MSLPGSDATALDDLLREVADAIGTPAYVYLTDAIERRLSELRAALGPWFSFSYAAKCNPNPELLRWLADRVERVDVSSIGEFRLAQAAGWGADRASFTGPGKRTAEIVDAVSGGVGEMVLESLREAVAVDRVAQSLGRRQDVLIRLSPARVPKGFGDHMAGRPSPFGLDVETAGDDLRRIMALRHLRVVGLHIYSGTQSLRPEAICENYRIFIEVFRSVCEDLDLRPETLVFGSGLGIPYHDQDNPLDLMAVADGAGPDLDALKAEPRFRDTRLVLELGRYLVGEAGYFLTQVTSVKESRGTRIGICDGGMNNHLPASGHFGMVIRRNYRMHRVGGGAPAEKIDLVGPLCTSIDRLATGVSMPRIEEGDLVAVHSSGAYGLTASPLHFISHGPPHEVLVEGARFRDVTRGWYLGQEADSDRGSAQDPGQTHQASDVATVGLD
ncbi:type III PLP-dependent enzyme [Rubellimicrobium rubrum]|uniref:Type III PLP-dependent enzyme n=1 Tax=Rubellimicrobium rubrum TaxID=2585369 RepID=A0A5C4MYX1_9RHOB|nr:type III PLP-dependent enzyme [Rubellimicrobium rubrum]TNC49137.1 type III PLP-dependent enzyme [Rubellimicrobium rubrum]